MIPALI